jgi:prephenate dehydrogenase
MGTRPEQDDRFDTLAIVGVGLLGGSIALAARAQGAARRIVGIGRNRERLLKAKLAGVVDDVAVDLSSARDAGLVVVCTPVDRIVADVAAAASASPAALITDVGSVKGSVCRGVEQSTTPHGRFIGSHPLAGSEQQGWENATATLFQGRVCVLTPAESSCAEDVARLERFWGKLGMTVVRMSPEDHDRTLALTSHLPHAVASALAALLTAEDLTFAATGFRDTTRIAAGDADLWTPIFLNNAEAVTERIGQLARRLEQFRQALAAGDAGTVQRLLEEGRRGRESLNP